uniref:BPL/LPL catalytic domain-containing protein n=1 Tax=Meloidogyne incognita TaxID=6306 RepID=A0A914NQI0_MELIC
MRSSSKLLLQIFASTFEFLKLVASLLQVFNFQNLKHICFNLKNTSILKNINVLQLLQDWGFPEMNSTSVVIGRYQNQFIEANVKFCEENNIKLVRRYRCGGAVYYDEGNFNFSILTSQDRHNRKENLQKLAKQLNMDFN